MNPRRTEGLRWWQQVVAYRLLEHDDQGGLVWRNALVTLARQVGKSWLVRALILWRMQQGERFGGGADGHPHGAPDADGDGGVAAGGAVGGGSGVACAVGER